MSRINKTLERRDQIIWALYDCLSERGHEKITIKMIADKAHLTSGIIHYYFQNKDEIISSLAEAIIKKYSQILDVQVTDAETIEQQIEYTTDFIVDIIFNRSLARVFYNLIQMTFEKKYLENVMKRMFYSYRKQCENIYKEAGLVQGIAFAGGELVAIIEGFTVQILINPKTFKKADVHQVISKTIWNRLNVSGFIKK